MPENLYKYFPTTNPNTWELLHPFTIVPTQPPPPPPDKENYEWTQVTNRKKQYNFFLQKQSDTLRTRNTKTTNVTSTNATPLGQQKKPKDRALSQAFLDDLGFPTQRPGPSQQYRTMSSQRQRAENHLSTNPQQTQTRSMFSPLSTANPPPLPNV